MGRGEGCTRAIGVGTSSLVLQRNTKVPQKFLIIKDGPAIGPKIIFLEAIVEDAESTPVSFCTQGPATPAMYYALQLNPPPSNTLMQKLCSVMLISRLSSQNKLRHHRVCRPLISPTDSSNVAAPRPLPGPQLVQAQVWQHPSVDVAAAAFHTLRHGCCFLFRTLHNGILDIFSSIDFPSNFYWDCGQPSLRFTLQFWYPQGNIFMAPWRNALPPAIHSVLHRPRSSPPSRRCGQRTHTPRWHSLQNGNT